MSANTTDTGNGWQDWAGVDGYSGFKVADPEGEGRVTMRQVLTSTFAVPTTFVFADRETIVTYRQRLEKMDRSAPEAEAMLNEACTHSAEQLYTDLASVPRFMLWFEPRYGRHTLAAILHDNLIRREPNDGPLKSDTLSDSFFRDMMGVAGMPLFKRWLMWAAVASRTRWAAGGLRRVSLLLWALTALIGLGATAIAIAGAFASLAGGLDHPGLALLVAVVLPFPSGLLWGRQYGASLVSAAAGLWLVPAAVFVLIGLGVYHLSEAAAHRISPRRPRPTDVLLPEAQPFSP